MKTKSMKVSLLVLMLAIALVAVVVQSPRSNVQSHDDGRATTHERARSTGEARDPQTNSLRYVSAGGFTEADYARHVDELKARIKKKLAADRSSGVSARGTSDESADGASVG